MFAVHEKFGQAVAHARRHQAAAAAHGFKDPEIQVPVLAMVEQHASLRKELAVVAARLAQARQATRQFPQKGGAPGRVFVDRAHEQAVPELGRAGAGLVVVLCEGRRPPDALGRQKGAGKKLQIVAQGNQAGVEALGVQGLPAVDVRIHAVKNRQTGKALHAQHKGRAAFVGHHQYVRDEPGQAHQFFPAEYAGVFKIVQGHILPAAGAQRLAEKRAADP